MQQNLDTLQQQLKDKQAILNGLYEEQPLAVDPEIKVKLKITISRYEAEITELKAQLQKSMGLVSESSESVLEEALRNISIPKGIDLINLVNCNRQNVVNRFWDSYDAFTESKNPYQFYFMVACPTQQPDSFAERMVYELRKEEADNDPDAVEFRRRSDGQRVAFDELPLGRNLRNAQKAFKSYFAERFALQQANSSFEEYLESGLPTLGYDYVAMNFDIQVSDWNNKMMNEYFQWIVDSFSPSNEQGATFWFIFVIFIRNLHDGTLDKRHQQVLGEVEKLVRANPQKCALISEMNPVEVSWLEDWLLGIDEEKNIGKIRAVINTFKASLSEEARKKYESSQLLDMTDIERLQAIIYKKSHE